MRFFDKAKIFIKSGDGGDGIASFRREKFVEFGGPNGGDGGKGGNVYFCANPSLTTLVDFRYQQHFFADNGKRGESANKTGASGKDLYISLPLGTEVIDAQNNTKLLEIMDPNEVKLFLPGGRGGWGNTRFKSSTNRAPRKFTSGKAGQEIEVVLQLKIIADVGIIGLPNVGKSTFLSKISRAKPKIGNYNFTTLYPNIGVVSYKDKELIFADIPGLIEGAHEGKGLGIEFLKHIQRCNMLLHFIDVSSEDPVRDYEIIQNEINIYSDENNINKKKQMVVLNKTDLVTPKSLKEIIEKFGFVENLLVSSQTDFDSINNTIGKIFTKYYFF